MTSNDLLRDAARLWQRIRDGLPTAVYGQLPEPPPDFHLLRVSCDVAPAELRPLMEARRRAEALLDEGQALLEQARERVVSGLRRRLLGEAPERGTEAVLVEVWNHLAQRGGRVWSLVFDEVEAADEGTLRSLAQILRRPGWLRLPLVLVFRGEPEGAAAELLATLRTHAGEEAVLHGDAPPAASTQAIDWNALPPEVLRVLRAGAIVGAGFEVEVVAALLGLDPLTTLERLQQAADLGVPLADRGDGRFSLPTRAMGALSSSVLPSLAQAWHRRLGQLLVARASVEEVGERVVGGAEASAAGEGERVARLQGGGEVFAPDSGLVGDVVAESDREDMSRGAGEAARRETLAEPSEAAVPGDTPRGEPAEADGGDVPGDRSRRGLAEADGGDVPGDRSRRTEADRGDVPGDRSRRTEADRGDVPGDRSRRTEADRGDVPGDRSRLTGADKSDVPGDRSQRGLAEADGGDASVDRSRLTGADKSDAPRDRSRRGRPTEVDGSDVLGDTAKRAASGSADGALYAARGEGTQQDGRPGAAGRAANDSALRREAAGDERRSAWEEERILRASVAEDEMFVRRPVPDVSEEDDFSREELGAPSAAVEPEALAEALAAAAAELAAEADEDSSRGAPADLRGPALRLLERLAARDSAPEAAGRGSSGGRVSRVPGGTVRIVDDPLIDEARAAEHLRLAGELDAAAERYLAAARAATGVGAPQAAAQHAQRALALLDALPGSPGRRRLRAQILLELGRLQWQSAGPGLGFTLADALSTLETARRELTPGDPMSLAAELCQTIAGVCFDLGDVRSLERALEELSAASRALHATGDATGAARLLNDQAAVYVRMGDPVRALHLLRESKKVFEARSADDPVVLRELAETDHLFARIPLHAQLRPGREQDGFTMGIDHALAAERAYRQLGDARELGRVWETMGRLELRKGRLERAAQRLQAALEVQMQLGDLTGLARTTEALSEVLAADGRHSDALALLHDSVLFNRDKGSPLGLAFNRRALVRLADRLADRVELAPALRELHALVTSVEGELGAIHLPGEAG